MDSKEIQASVAQFAAKKKADRLDWLLTQIKKKMAEIGQHLKDIRDEKLYDPKFETFEEFCQSTFGFGNKRANQLIAAENIRLLLAGQVADDVELSETVSKMKERPLRAIAQAPETARVEILREAGPRPTAIKIKQAKARIIPSDPEPPAPKLKLCPHCGQRMP